MAAGASLSLTYEVEVGGPFMTERPVAQAFPGATALTMLDVYGMCGRLTGVTP